MEEMVLDPGPLGLGDVAAVDENDADVRRGVRAGRARSPAGRRRASKPSSLMSDELLGRASGRQGCASAMPSRTWALIPATRTMKNSSRLLAEIDRNRTRSSSGMAVD